METIHEEEELFNSFKIFFFNNYINILWEFWYLLETEWCCAVLKTVHNFVAVLTFQFSWFHVDGEYHNQSIMKQSNRKASFISPPTDCTNNQLWPAFLNKIIPEQIYKPGIQISSNLDVANRRRPVFCKVNLFLSMVSTSS